MIGLIHGVFNFHSTVEQAVTGMEMQMTEWYLAHGNPLHSLEKEEDKITRGR
jgi:hypothetical protein